MLGYDIVTRTPPNERRSSALAPGPALSPDVGPGLGWGREGVAYARRARCIQLPRL